MMNNSFLVLHAYWCIMQLVTRIFSFSSLWTLSKLPVRSQVSSYTSTVSAPAILRQGVHQVSVGLSTQRVSDWSGYETKFQTNKLTNKIISISTKGRGLKLFLFLIFRNDHVGSSLMFIDKTKKMYIRKQ